MASSSRDSAGADEVGNQIPEDLVLSWTRDATTINTYGTFVENDRQLLEDLIQCVHNATKQGTDANATKQGTDANATKQKLTELLGTGKDRKSVVIRAIVLTRLIAIALGLHPDDITIDSKTGKESWISSVDFKTASRSRLDEALQHDNTVLSYLFKDALEADDEVMTVIFCDRRLFKRYQVPYFHGCDLAVVQEISNLWLSQEFLRGFYYYTVLEPIFNKVKAEQLKVTGTPPKISEENLLEATEKLCELLQGRTVKAGARLLSVMLSFRKDRTYSVLKLVNELVIPLVGLKNGKFRKCFFGDFENRAREARWCSRGSDQVYGRHGQSITVGPSSAQTDSNLLCWAARRGYSNLISCISLGYTEACQISPNENLLEDAAEALTVSLLWKVALWCATRHGHDSVVMELTGPLWVKSVDFNDYTGIQGCLPPLHLVSLLGDSSLLRWLCMGQVGIETGAHKTDYLGKTPLDYAMQFQLTTRNSEEGMLFQVIANDIKDRMQFQAPNNEFKEWTQLRPVARYFPTRMQYPPYYRGGMPMPTPRHQSCIRELLQMPGVADRLKELNDMYITQANFVLIGAALIASVAFVGWLQPPLGYADYFQFTESSPPAPAGTYEHYVAVEGHLSVQLFVAFNALSFFLGIGTMLIGAEATLFFHDNDERTLALTKVRKSIKWMLGFFVTSMVCIMAAFICAGLAILPPIQRLKWSMIVSLCLGACICLIPLTWILFSLARDQLVKLKDQMVKLFMQFNKEKKLDDPLKDLGGSLVDDEDMKTLQDAEKRRCRKQPYAEPNSPYGARQFVENRFPDSFRLYDAYDDEFGRVEYPPMDYGRYGRSVSYENHERPGAPQVVVVSPPRRVVVRSPTPRIQRTQSWA